MSRPENDKNAVETSKSGGLEFVFVNLSKITQAPVVSEKVWKSKPYTLFGKKNLFPSELIDLADNSSLHASILKSVESYIMGQGIEFEGDVTEAEKFYNESLEKMKQDDYTFRQRVAADIAKFGGYYLNVAYNRGGDIDRFKHIDYSWIRTDKKLDEYGVPKSYWVSQDWKIGNKNTFTEDEKQFMPFEVDAFGNRTALTRSKGQILQIKDYKAGKRFYSEPTYMGALNYIDLSSRIGDFHNNSLSNGMMGNTHVHIYEDLSDPEKRKAVEKSMNKKFAGDDNAGKIILTYSSDPEHKPEFTVLQSPDIHQRLALLQETTGKEIAMAHRFPPELIGFDNNSGLSSRGKAINENLELVQNVVIEPYQQMLARGINVLLKTNGINATATIIPLVMTEENEEELKDAGELTNNSSEDGINS